MAHFTARVLDDRRIELPEGALGLIAPGQEIEIDLAISQPLAPQANQKALKILDDLALMKKDMPESDPSETDEIIRKGRSGAMYADHH